MGLIDRIKRGWNAFANNRDPTYFKYSNIDMGASYTYRPDRVRFSRGSEKTIVTAIYNRIALDVAAISIRHVQLDKDNRFTETVDSGLDNCLTIEANIDQTGRSLIQDIVMSALDEGVVAVVPVDTTTDPTQSSGFDVQSLRTGKILDWYPKHVKVRLYNERTGKKEDLILPKSMVAIIENPFFAVVNEHNSTVQRLIRKLALLDVIDERGSADRLDLIIQLPYIIKTDTRREQAEKRRQEIEMQLANSKYGIAYTDGTERITQLNRPVENNLLKQIEYLTSMAFAQLNFHQSILDGTADEKTMLNYTNRTIEPFVSAIVDEFKRKFISKTSRTQGKSIMFFREPFKLVPANELAEIVDKFTRNEIMSSNEFRQVIGLKPSKDPKADQLVNSNISQPEDKPPKEEEVPKESSSKNEETIKEEENQNGEV